MILFEMMPMEGKLIVLGSLCLVWTLAYKLLRPTEGAPGYLAKFRILHVALGVVGGMVVGLVLSTFTGRADAQTGYALVGALVGAVLLGGYALSLRDPAKVGAVIKSDVEWGDTGWISLYAAAAIMYVLVQMFEIPSGSMLPTLQIRDRLFVNKLIYGVKVPFTRNTRLLRFREVQRGDIVVFNCPQEALTRAERERHIQKDFVKRCVAVGGDTVHIVDKRLYVNGDVVPDRYAVFWDTHTIYPTRPDLYKSSEEYQRAWEQGYFAVVAERIGAQVFRDNFGPVVVPPGYFFVMGDNRDYSFDSRFWGPLEARELKGTPLIIVWPPRRIGMPR